MIGLLLKKELTDVKSGNNQKARLAIAQKCSVFGIILNLLLFVGKLLVGTFSGSIAITSDAFNNLSDAGSSLITLFGIRLSLKKPDPEHPFGHGRIEYLSGLAVSVLILLMGFELAKESFYKILNPTPQNDPYFVFTLTVLSISVLVKLYMWHYNRKYGKLIHAAAMTATSLDSLSDSASTFVVLLSSIFSRLFDLYILDGICGFAVALFILYAGYSAAKETLLPILGQAPDPELVYEIKATVLSHEAILGIHDLVVHDYGPGRRMATLHAEVPHNQGSIFELHDLIDNIEFEIKEKTGCETVIHMDPVDADNPETLALKDEITQIINSLYPTVGFHDFRVVYGPTHTNLIFDIVKPYEIKEKSGVICQRIKDEVKCNHPKFECVIQVDHDYTQTKIQ